MAKFGSLFAWISYLLIVLLSIGYFFKKSHYDTIYLVTETHSLLALKPHLNDVYDLVDENVKTEQLDGDLVVMIKSFTGIFGQICNSWKYDNVKNSKNCLKMNPCDLYSNSVKLERLIDENKPRTLDEIQELFDTHFNAKSTFVYCAVSLSNYRYNLIARKNERIPYSELYIKRQLSSDNSQNKTVTSGVLAQIYKSFLSNALNYIDCEKDLKEILGETLSENLFEFESLYSTEIYKLFQESVDLNKDLQELIMKIVLKLSSRNQEMKYFNSTYWVTHRIGLINLMIMLIFYFCPIIPFCLAFGIQLLYRTLYCRVFGKPKVEQLWALKCLKNNVRIETASINPKRIVRLLKSKAKKNRRKSKK